jgi:hypothetical protein
VFHPFNQGCKYRESRLIETMPAKNYFPAYTLTLKSLNASFKLVLRSVEGLRCPMINAQPTPYSPAGNFLV